MKMTFTPRFWLSLALVVAGVVLRIIPHPWNFAPVGAIALFAGAHFERRSWAIAVPLLTMLAGDAIIGFHSLMPFVYLSYALIAAIGMLLRGRRTSLPAVGGGFLVSSTIFYLITNFAVWMMGTMYAKTAAGLVACYVAAIPFYGNTLASDAIYTAAFFGIFAVSERQIPMFART
ncbi:MAG TPA: DUF6580 family putative transport protein [Thermoanaerobaculia bacterium]|nr:DUF6580 family putative transport protein [Thermoanaerobaculia bacterium]